MYLQYEAMMKKYTKPEQIERIERYAVETAICLYQKESEEFVRVVKELFGRVVKEPSVFKRNQTADIFAATFLSQKEKHIKDLSITQEELGSYYFESIFILSVQVIVSFIIFKYGYDGTKYEKYKVFHTTDNFDSYYVNLCLIFTNFALHICCLSTTRNGLDMCNYVTYNSKEFRSPFLAFTLGFFTTIITMMVEICNIYNSIRIPSLTKLIGKFVSFKMLVQIQDYYLKGRENFKPKGVIGKDSLPIQGDMSIRPPAGANAAAVGIYHFLYVLLRTVYAVVYYYMFPLLPMFLPFYEIIKSGIL